jgi:hypothetical protein
MKYLIVMILTKNGSYSMTTAEALLAMKIGCKVIPATWTDYTNYYDLRGDCICYVNKPLNFVSLACNVNKFTEEYEGKEWKLYEC